MGFNAFGTYRLRMLFFTLHTFGQWRLLVSKQFEHVYTYSHRTFIVVLRILYYLFITLWEPTVFNSTRMVLAIHNPRYTRINEKVRCFSIHLRLKYNFCLDTIIFFYVFNTLFGLLCACQFFPEQPSAILVATFAQIHKSNETFTTTE